MLELTSESDVRSITSWEEDIFLGTFHSSLLHLDQLNHNWLFLLLSKSEHSILVALEFCRFSKQLFIFL